MWSNLKAKTALVTAICFLIVGAVFFGTLVSSHTANAAPVAASHAHSILSTDSIKTNAAPFRVTSISMSATPSTTSLWKCGSYIQVVYTAVFHVISGPTGGTIVFYYTINNGRGQTSAKLTILPGQKQSDFVFTWQGSLPSDHFYPEPGGVQVTSPNVIVSPLVGPSGQCR